MPQVVVTADEVRRLSQGQSIPNRSQAAAAELAAIDESRNLVAIVAPQLDGTLRPRKYFGGT
jgi:hypothetical protein